MPLIYFLFENLMHILFQIFSLPQLKLILMRNIYSTNKKFHLINESYIYTNRMQRIEINILSSKEQIPKKKESHRIARSLNTT